jgi:hypothetical protein
MDAPRMTALRQWSITLVTAAVTAAVLVIPAVLLLDGGDSAESASTQPLGTLGRAQATQAAPAPGPEGVPLPGGRPLGPAGSPSAGHSRGGIPCGSTEQLRYHVHARLTIFVNGKPRGVPLGIGIGRPLRVDHTPRGQFAADGSCFSLLHTHAADGIIHIEAPGEVQFRLGQFFAVWGQRLDRRHLGAVRGRVTAYVNGERYRGDPRGILLLKHAQIQLEVGKHVASTPIEFPAGL